MHVIVTLLVQLLLVSITPTNLVQLCSLVASHRHWHKLNAPSGLAARAAAAAAVEAAAKSAGAAAATAAVLLPLLTLLL